MAVAKAALMLKKFLSEVDPDELREQLGEALDDPNVREQLAGQSRSKIGAAYSMIAGAASRIFTGTLLRQAWMSAWSVFLLVIPIGYVGLAYLNLHFFARHLMHRKAFTPLGSEWQGWRMIIGWGNFALKYVEIAGIMILDLLFILEILAVITLLGIIGRILANPIEAAGVFGAEIVSYFTS